MPITPVNYPAPGTDLRPLELDLMPTRLRVDPKSPAAVFAADVSGPRALVDAAEDILAGRKVRFACIQYINDRGWVFRGLIVIQKEPFGDLPVRAAGGNVDPFTHPHSEALQFYPALAGNPVAELAVVLSRHLGDFLRLVNG